MKKIMIAAILFSSLLVFFTGYAFAIPPGPPPAGKVWVEVNGEWISVIVPPGEGPYLWREGKWVIDPAPPPPDADWVPGHWVPEHWKGNTLIPGHWVAGHWERMTPQVKGAKWVPGRWKGNTWVAGHWAGTAPPGKHWVPGHRGPGGRWIPGHWK